MRTALSALPLGEWQPTRDRLHRWARLAGAVRRQRNPRRKHWWHISLLPNARGLTTGTFTLGDGHGEVTLDFARGELVLAIASGDERRLPLTDDPAREGRARLAELLAELDAPVDLPGFEQPTTGAYDPAAALAYLRVLLTVEGALRAWQAEVPRECSPVQLWPHHFDLAVSRFSGRTIAGRETAEPDDRDESVTIGFSTGDGGDPAPYLYALAYPWPEAVESTPLPVGRWHGPGWSGGHLAWADALRSDDAAGTVLAFARATHHALAEAQQRA